MDTLQQMRLAINARNGVLYLRTSNEEELYRSMTQTWLAAANSRVIAWDLVLGETVTDQRSEAGKHTRYLTDWRRDVAGEPALPLTGFINSVGKSEVYYCPTCGFMGQDKNKAIEHWTNAHSKSADAMPGLVNTLYIVRGIGPYITGDNADPMLLRMLYTASIQTRRAARDNMIVILPLEASLPDSLLQVGTLVDDALPTRQVIKSAIWPQCLKGIRFRQDGQGGEVPTKYNKVFDGLNPLDSDTAQQVADTLAGLTMPEIEAAIKAAVLETELASVAEPAARWAHLKASMLKAKVAGLRRSSALELLQPVDPQDVGGMGALRNWLTRRAAALRADAQAAGVPAPKGVVLTGVPGTGKSLIARSIGSTLRLPVVRFDIGAVFGQYVGQSESAMRNAIRTVEAIAPCVLMMDEIDKGFSGVGGGSTDGGTTQRVFGTFLTWMQERASINPVFVVATANNVSGLPPEMLRKGRFDELFFVDLPNADERIEILNIHLGKVKTSKSIENLAAVATACKDFSGSEIGQAVIEAQINAYADNAPLSGAYLQEAIAATRPLSQTMREQLAALREWAKTRARSASYEIAPQVQQVAHAAIEGITIGED